MKKKPKLNLHNALEKIESLERQLAEAQAKVKAADVVVLQKELQRLRSKIRKHEAASSIIVSALKGLLGESPLELKPLKWSPTGPKATGRAKAMALIHLTDLHFGKVTATYDTSIAKERLRELTKKVLKAVKVHHRSQNVQELRIYLTGDMVEAENIFPHQAHQIDASVYQEACFEAPQALAEMILAFRSAFKKVKVCAVKGNHGRVGRKSDGFAKETNWDLIVYRITDLLVRMAEKPGLGSYEMLVGTRFHLVDDLLGHKNLLFHGDNIRGYAGFPWYGVSKKIAGWIDSIGTEWHNAYFGHFHQYVSADWNNRLWFCSGTLESDNEFALEQMASCSRPTQRLQLWAADYPGPVVDMPIYLESGLDREVGPFFKRRRP